MLVWGATGVVGRAVAEHLARDYQGKVQWAIAGRNKQKLESVRQELAKLHPAAKDVPLVLADLKDQASLDAMASKAKVVLSTAGPYAKLGTPVVQACVNSRTHYADITGETPWVKRIIEQFHDDAERKGIKIIPLCGFDSVPSDMGTFFLTEYMRQKLGKHCAHAHHLVGALVSSLGGGTAASLLGFIEDPGNRKLVHDPYALNPPDSKRGPDKPDSVAPVYDSEAHKWGFPFVMAPINTRVVRRSNALLGHRYGDNFSYTEHMAASNWLTAYLGSAAMTLGLLFTTLKPFQAILHRLLPKPGQGPSREQQLKGYWNSQVVGVTEESAGSKPQVAIAKLKGAHDPAFWDTSRMLLEAGLCMALQQDELRQAGTVTAGVLTPASGLGMPLIKRLQKAGISFKIAGDETWEN